MMKKIRKNTLKSIIATALSAAILLTGITFGDATTAEAKATYVNPYDKSAFGLDNVADVLNTTVTMQVGDKKSFDYMEHEASYSMDYTDAYDWTSSDESIVNMHRQFWGNNPDNLAFFVLTAEKPGTVTITGIGKKQKDTVSFKVTVKGATATAKQKACKHAWKTTRKATCAETGVKACKRCGLKKTIKQKNHKWKTVTKQETKYKAYSIYFCNGCACDLPVSERHDRNPETDVVGCDHVCFAEFRERDYGSKQAALDALFDHYDKYQHLGSVNETFEYDDPYKVTVKTTICKTCGMTPEQAVRVMMKESVFPER